MEEGVLRRRINEILLRHRSRSAASTSTSAPVSVSVAGQLHGDGDCRATLLLPPELVEMVFERLVALPEHVAPHALARSVAAFCALSSTCKFMMECACASPCSLEVLVRLARHDCQMPYPQRFFDEYLAQERELLLLKSFKAAIRSLATHCATHHCRGARTIHNLQQGAHPLDPLGRLIASTGLPVLRSAWRFAASCIADGGVAASSNGALGCAPARRGLLVAHARRGCGCVTRLVASAGNAFDAASEICHADVPALTPPGTAAAPVDEAPLVRLMAARGTRIAAYSVAVEADGRHVGRIVVHDTASGTSTTIDAATDVVSHLWFSDTYLWSLYYTHCDFRRVQLRAHLASKPSVLRIVSFPSAAVVPGSATVIAGGGGGGGAATGPSTVRTDLIDASTSPSRLVVLMDQGDGQSMHVLTSELEVSTCTPPLVAFTEVTDRFEAKSLLFPRSVQILPSAATPNGARIAVFFQARSGECFFRVFCADYPSHSFVPVVSIRLQETLRQTQRLLSAPAQTCCSPCGRFLVSVHASASGSYGMLVLDQLRETSCFVRARIDALPTRVVWNDDGLWCLCTTGVLLFSLC